MSLHRRPRPAKRQPVTRHTPAAPVDDRLNSEQLSPRLLQQILSDHDCSVDRCSECGHVSTRRQPICRSAAIARAVLWGRKLTWHDETPATTTDLPVDQFDLFASETA